MTPKNYRNKRYPSDFVGPPIQKASVYILARIARGCKICEDCGAPWHWDVTVAPGVSPQINVCGHLLAIRRAVYILKHGRQPPKGSRATSSCPNQHCCDPNKVVARRISQMVKDTYTNGARDPAVSRRTLQKHTDANNRKLSIAQVVKIRTDGRPPKVAAPEYGITPEYFRRIRSGLVRTEASQLGAYADLGMFSGLVANSGRMEQRA